jgi:serine protease inhibitor
MSDVAAAVRASNLLTRAWVERLHRGRNDVVSGAGAWLLLTALLHAADGTARGELQGAMFTDHDRAASMVRRLSHLVTSTDGVTGAAGLWVHREVSLDPKYTKALPDFTVSEIPADMAVLDRWASEHTSGLITQFPGTITADTRLVAATALAAIAEWERPFVDGAGSWVADDGTVQWLSRTDDDLDGAALLTRGSLTISRVICRGDAGFDVHLVAGADQDTPGAVLGLGVDALGGGVSMVPAVELGVGDRGGCLLVEMMPSGGPDPQLRLSLPAFEVSSDHDLLRDATLFGLVSAQDTSRGHFPGLSSYPLAVASAAQSAIASFSAKGFKAAAVTMVAMVRAAGATRPTKVVRVDFDRPFGFVVVERRHNLALFAGWIAQPVPPKA